MTSLPVSSYRIVQYGPGSLIVDLPDEAATMAFGNTVSLFLKPGDTVALVGDLGTGKTTLARAAIRALAGDPELDVSSPTFTLVQTYGCKRGEIVHVDLYRIEHSEEIWELGLEDLTDSAIMLIEWPDRLEKGQAEPGLTMTLCETPSGGRTASIEAGAEFCTRITRLVESEAFLEGAGWSGSARRFFQGDASSRRYERLCGDQGDTVLMDMPRQPDGPPVKNGMPYSAVAHLAEDVTPFVAVAKVLMQAGLSAPAIRAQDLDHGFLITEDFGDAVYAALIRDGEPLEEPYRAAVDALLALKTAAVPDQIGLEGGRVHSFPHYDLDALMIEVGLVTDWFWPQVHGSDITGLQRNRFEAVWQPLLDQVDGRSVVCDRTLVLRDYHSPNLMWLPERVGPRRTGLLDFQDAVIGHAAYDLMSLLQDARTDLPEGFERRWLDYYCNARQSGDVTFDEAGFRKAYAILGAQRATKILGIFVRLCIRDAKPQYLRHIPRVSGHLERNLAHAGLEDLKAWYAQHLPADVRLSLSKIGEHL